MTASSSASVFAMKCVPKGSHCVAPGHQGQIGPDGMCRMMRAVIRDTKTCALCQERPVMAKAARVLNPIFLVGLIRGIVVTPTMKFNLDRARAYNAAIQLSGQGFCEQCVANVEPHVNATTSHPGKIEFKSGSKVPMFLDPEGLRNAWTAISAGVAKLCERIKGGTSFSFGRIKGRGEGLLTECVVHRNHEAACLCGGWHPAAEMPTLTQGENRHFGFGPMCAEAARRSGFQLGPTMAEQLSAIHTARFMAELAEKTRQREERERLERDGVFIDGYGHEHLGAEAIARALADRNKRSLAKAHELKAAGRHVPEALQILLDEEEAAKRDEDEGEYVESTTTRRPKARREPAVMSPEDQLRRLAEKAAEKRRKRLAAEARRQDPNFGAMAPRAPKQGKKKSEGDSKKRARKEKAA